MIKRTGLRILSLKGELGFASKAKPEHTKVFPRRNIKRSITVLPSRKKNHTDKTLFNGKEKKQEISTRERIRLSGFVILCFEANPSAPQCLQSEVNIAEFMMSHYSYYVNFPYGVGQFENNFPLLCGIYGINISKTGQYWLHNMPKSTWKTR